MGTWPWRLLYVSTRILKWMLCCIGTSEGSMELVWCGFYFTLLQRWIKSHLPSFHLIFVPVLRPPSFNLSLLLTFSSLLHLPSPHPPFLSTVISPSPSPVSRPLHLVLSSSLAVSWSFPWRRSWFLQKQFQTTDNKAVELERERLCGADTKTMCILGKERKERVHDVLTGRRLNVQEEKMRYTGSVSK